MDVRNLYLGIISAAAGGAFIAFSGRLDAMPALFPKIVAAGLLLLGLFTFGTQCVLLLMRKEARVEFITGVKTIGWRKEFKLLPILGAALLYAALFKKIGFVILTPPLIFAVAYYFGYKKKFVLIGVSLGFSLVLYLLFGLFLNVPIPLLPQGV